MAKHGILPQQDGGGTFTGPWGILMFHLPLGGLAKWGVKIFHTFFWEGGMRGKRVFSTEEMGRAPPPLAKNLLISPPPGKIPPSRLPLPNFYAPTKG